MLTRSAKKLYLLVLGQCTKSLRAKMKGKDNWNKMDDKSESVELLSMIKEISSKVDTVNNIYMTTWKVKQETANIFQNNDTPERYLEKFLRKIQVGKQNECGIWLDDGTIMSELR